jgi:2-oxoglutarate/2-oxoacid ferredoxin oxidoreductase subunit alpha
MSTNTHFTIRIAGPAWLGMHSIMDIIANAFASLGQQIITDSEYQSIIKWGLNYYDVHVCSETPYITRAVDILISLNEKNITPNLRDLKKWGLLIANQKWIEKIEVNFPDLRQEYIVIDPLIEDKYENTYLLGILAGYLGLDTTVFEPAITRAFAKKGEEVIAKNIEILREYATSWAKKNEAWNMRSLIAIWKSPMNVTYGNKALAYGAIASELEFFSAYPMTPASTVLSEIVNSKKVNYLQAEDEIAVMNTALGASFTGKRSMVATSGGGFALMTEALSFAAQAEFPIVAILSQRAGPSTGTPTYHEQSEISYALVPTFGGGDHVVLIPSTMEEAYYMGGQALNIAQKYQTTVIILTDKQFSEGKVSITALEPAPVDRGKLVTNPEDGFKRYELTDDGVSPYVRVGTEKGDFIATSYEHDEYGATTEEMEMKVAMTEKRARKLQDFYTKEGIMGYRVVNPGAKKMILTFSLTSYTTEAWVRENPLWGVIIITCLKPLDARLRDVIVALDRVVFVESNYSGQLEDYVTKELGLRFVEGLEISHIRKYDLMPFFYEDFDSLV